ncbi:MAG: hypothetical protein AAGL08_20800 [Cyanobacteria bacterium J06573_11]
MSFLAIFSKSDFTSNGLPRQLRLSGSLETTTSRANVSGVDLQPMTLFASAGGSTVSEVLQDAKEIAAQAMERTDVLRSQTWNDSTSEQAWSRVETLWQTAANSLSEVALYDPIAANRAEVLASNELKTHYHDYSNWQDLTLAMRDYQKSVFLAQQLDPGDATTCDVQTRLSDSPEKWAMVVALRQQSVDHLRAVARNVSFYDEQVVPLQAHYQAELETAIQMHQRSPWYYAIQKAVCATAWGERAKESGAREDWMQSVAFWKEGIALLEDAPERIPMEIPNRYRDSYQLAQGNLELWKDNLKDAESRARDREVGSGER